MSKKYLIVHKKKIDLLNNEYLFYNTSVEFINKISDNKNKIKSISSKNSTYVGKAIFSKTKGKIEFLNNLNILEGKLYIKKGIN